MKRLFHCYRLPLLSGLLAALPFLWFSLAPAAWFALVPLLGVLSRSRRPGEGFRAGLAFGLVFWLVSIFWLASVTAGGYLALAFYLALFSGLWGAAVVLLNRRPALAWWAPALVWAGLEYVRAALFGGFPWNPFGASQAYIPSLIQLSAWTGVYGISFLVVLANAALERICRGGKGRAVPAALVLLLLGAVWVGGRFRLRDGDREAAAAPGLALALVQGGIPQELKWDPLHAGGIFERYLELTRQALAAGGELAVWPESALPWYLEDSPRTLQTLSALAASGPAALVIGGDARRENPKAFFNSAFFFDSGGFYRSRYDKLHLVPFGEYVPLGGRLPLLRRVVPWEEDFSSGAKPVLFGLSRPEGTLRIGVLICFEDIIPVLSADLVRSGAGLVLNLTNDAWFGRSPQPYQHAAGAVFRAVENRINLARATNTGYSCLIDPWGRVTGEVRGRDGRVLYASAWALLEARLVAPGTFYTRYGDLFALFCLFAGALLTVAGLYQGGQKNRLKAED